MGGGLCFKEKKCQISSYRPGLWKRRLHQVNNIISHIIIIVLERWTHMITYDL